jgi:hypothetical protein
MSLEILNMSHNPLCAFHFPVGALDSLQKHV